MQIKESAKTVMFIRFHYDPEIKRTKGKVFASQPINQKRLDFDIEKMMTPKEVVEFQIWRAKRDQELKTAAMTEALNSFVAQAQLASDAIQDKEITEEMKAEDWAAIWQALDGMSKSLRKAKIKKPARAAKSDKAVEALTDGGETTDTVVPAGEPTVAPAAEGETTDTVVDRIESNEPSSKH